MSTDGVPHEELAGGFRGTIDIEWIWSRLLRVGIGSRAVEDVIGAHMTEENVEFLTCHRKLPDRQTIYGEGPLRILFAGFDLVERRGIYQDIRLEGLQHASRLLPVAHIQISMCDGNQLIFGIC